MSVIETSLLTKSFGDLKAADSMKLSVVATEARGILGPNCAGKTTVVKMLTTLLPPPSGWPAVAGYDVHHDVAQARAEIGYAQQRVSVDGTLTACENLLNWNPVALAGVAVAVILCAAAFSSFSFVLACIAKGRKRFIGIGQILIRPLFIAGNAVDPISITPEWLKIVAHTNPLTYEADGMRALMVEGGVTL